MSDLEELAKAELSREGDAPVSIPQEEYAAWRKQYEAIQECCNAAEELIAAYLTEHGLTATTPKHLMFNMNLSEMKVVEGKAPPDADRPAHLRGFNLDICNFTLPGVVVAYMDAQTRKFVRVKRNPKPGELADLIKKMEKQHADATVEAEDTKAAVPGEGTAL